MPGFILNVWRSYKWAQYQSLAVHKMYMFGEGLVYIYFDVAGIGKLSTADGKALTDPEVLRKLTSSVSCALDEAAQALHRMRAEQQSQLGNTDR